VTDDTFELQLDAMAHGGSALGRHDKRTIFVPYTIPGERIQARITQDKGRVAFAEGVMLLEASADRVFPRCPHFGPGRCGRCHWQHIDYAAQLLLKQDVLADQLARIGGFDDADVRSVIAGPLEWGYNYHMTLLAGEDNKLGFLGANDGVFPISECHILHPDLLALYQSLDLNFPGLRSLKLQMGTDGAPMLILTMAEDSAPELETDLPASVNMLLADNEPVNLIGESHSRYEVAGRVFRVTAGSAFRGNVSLLETLVSLVTEALGEAETVLDLYAGVGLFTAFIAGRAQQVTLVESYPPAATDAESNLNDFDNVDIIEGAVEDVLAGLEETYDAAVLDPPPDGLSIDTVDLLAEAAIPRLVYVSSDPATLARDGKRLSQQGYSLSYVQPLDLSPQTYYIDSVALFQRR
jgi:23S rRNA (uracil1939-C5)-methyltransferase